MKTILSKRKKDKIFCTNCGLTIKPFYSYCIHCGASTEDNPKCHPDIKAAKQFLENAKADHAKLNTYRQTIEDETIAGDMKELSDKLDVLISKMNEDVEAQTHFSDVRSLFNIYLPGLVELTEKYIKFQNDPGAGDRIREFNKEFDEGLKNFSKVLDSANDQIYENTMMDIEIDLDVLDGFLKRSI